LKYGFLGLDSGAWKHSSVGEATIVSPTKSFWNCWIKLIFPGEERAFAIDLFHSVQRNLSLFDFWIDRLRPHSLDANSRDIPRLGLTKATWSVRAGCIPRS